MKKTIWFWLCFVFAIILATYFTTRIVMTKMGHGTVAHVHHVSILVDSPDVDLSALNSTLNIPKNTLVYNIDLEEKNTALLNVPGVKYSSVRRLPNGNISIHATMHNVLGVYQQSDGLFYPISDDGFIVSSPTNERPTGTILFRGAQPKNITKITNAIRPIAGMLDYIELIEDRRWDIYTTNGIRVMLTEDISATQEYEPGVAIAKLLSLNQEKQILSRAIKTIDLRDSKRVLVKQ